MASLSLSRRLVCLFGIGWLIGVADVHAQSPLDAQKRSFARLLARRERASQAAAHRATVAARHPAGLHVEASRSPLLESGAPRPARSTLALFAVPNPSSSDGIEGRSAATPVTPSGYGAGRDAFVETMYFDTFGREPKERELVRLTRRLASGMAPTSLARILWDSPEHRALLRSHRAPAYTFGEAYRQALASGWAARRARRQRVLQ